MQGWKTIAFFTITGLLGLVTALEGVPVKEIALQMVCHAPVDAQIVADECTGKIVKYSGYFVAGMSFAGAWLRTITTSSIFKSLK